MLKNKKGQVTGLNDLPSVALTILLTGVFFVIGIIILTSFEDNSVNVETVVNETFTTPALTGNITLANTPVVAITQIQNASGIVLGTGNYSLVDAATGRVQFLGNTTACKTGQLCNVTYTYQDYEATTPVAIENTIAAMAEIPSNWLVLIAVIIAASIIIGIVISNLGGASSR